MTDPQYLHSPDTIASVLRHKAALRPLWIPVSGDSMGRALGRGRVSVEPRPCPRRGEIWAFSAEGRIVVHRVLGVRGRQVWLQGDANEVPDQPIHISALIGKVVVIENAAGDCRSLGRRSRLLGRALVDARALKRRLVSFARSIGFVKISSGD